MVEYQATKRNDRTSFRPQNVEHIQLTKVP